METTRRDFLKRAAALSAWPTLITSGALGTRAAFGQAGTAPASERLRFGVIGCGGQGRGNMGPHLKDIVAVADVDLKRAGDGAAAVEKAGGKAEVYQDYRRLLDRKDVDAVLISTPDHWHALATIHACMAGKDVYCEKPLTLTVAEGRAMVNAARKYGRVVQTGSQQRSDAKFRLACELIRNKKIGKIKEILVGIPGVNYGGKDEPAAPVPAELNYDMWVGPAPFRPYNPRHVHYNFRFFWAFSGGQMTNWGAHHLDIVQWALGMDDSGPVKIEGTPTYKDGQAWEVPQESNVTYTYADGTVVRCGNKNRGGITFVGENGTIFVNRGKLETTPAELATTTWTDADVKLYASTSHHGDWLNCIKSRKNPICDVAIGHRSATVCHLGNIAMRVGRPLTWDPAKETIVGDDDAAKRLTYAYRDPYTMPTI
ncbi:MAG: Gfo/Idh/MocA family oxidoreductase [Armatimonadetes bacterium]|nr:Gfo/Idh/MocA family oxidoreductase [Armatimonadota bacterium]